MAFDNASFAADRGTTRTFIDAGVKN